MTSQYNRGRLTQNPIMRCFDVWAWVKGKLHEQPTNQRSKMTNAEAVELLCAGNVLPTDHGRTSLRVEYCPALTALSVPEGVTSLHVGYCPALTDLGKHAQLLFHDPRGYVVIWYGGKVHTGCRHITLNKAKQHWGKGYAGVRKIGDMYLAAIREIGND